MSKGSATGILAEEGSNVTIIREGNAKTTVYADNGYEATGIDAQGTVNLTEKGYASTQVGREDRAESKGTRSTGEVGTAIAIKAGEKSNLSVTRQDHVSYNIVPSEKCHAVDMKATKGANVKIHEMGNFSSHVGTGGQRSHGQNGSSGAVDQGGKIRIKCRIFSGKGATEYLQVDRHDEVQAIVGKYREPGDVVYCGERKLDCDKTFAENEVKENDILRVGKEVIVTSNSGRRRVA